MPYEPHADVDFVRDTSAGIQLRYPIADQREVFLRAVAIRVPRELMILAYGWDPAAHE